MAPRQKEAAAVLFFASWKFQKEKEKTPSFVFFFFLFVDNAYYFADEAILDFRRKIVQVD